MTPEMVGQLVTLVDPEDSLFDTAQRIANEKVAFYGLAVIVDSKQRVLGVINDGDFLRLIANKADLSQAVKTQMIKGPVTVTEHVSHDEIISEVRRQLRERNGQEKETVRYVLVVNDDNVLTNIFRYVDLLSHYKRFGEKVAIYGQGFVGLTLAAALASRGHDVTGIDSNPKLVKDLNQGKVHIHEPRLGDTVRASLKKEILLFKETSQNFTTDVYIIAVGTPVDNKGKVDLEAIKNVCNDIAKRLKRGDLVMLRSTVPTGTTRNTIKTLLEKLTGLKAGQDFYIAFTPERTVEGNAMTELISLPQIVGGLTPICSQRASTFWATLTDSVIQVNGLEAAELIKLLNNSFRDLSFAFSNAFALLCDKYNLDAFQVINAANEGYPRNKIHSPSPGVGGYCLTKDPYLYASDEPSLGHAQLAKAGRDINQKSAEYPVQIVKQYAKANGKKLSDMKVLIIGLAFKGWPETNDLRGSTALQTAKSLQKKGAYVMAWDAVIKPEVIEQEGIIAGDIFAACEIANAILILNNHPQNTPEGLIPHCNSKKTLIFDGWSMLDRRSIEHISNLTYATMGYMTPLSEENVDVLNNRKS